jgi:hypothetical protein
MDIKYALVMHKLSPISYAPTHISQKAAKQGVAFVFYIYDVTHKSSPKCYAPTDMLNGTYATTVNMVRYEAR